MRWNVLQGLVFGLIAGIVLTAFFLWDGWGYISLILLPLCVIMGVLPQVLKFKDDDERWRSLWGGRFSSDFRGMLALRDYGLSTLEGGVRVKSSYFVSSRCLERQ